MRTENHCSLILISLFSFIQCPAIKIHSAAGEVFVAEARVMKAGKTLTVTRCDVYGRTIDESKLVATMLATMIRQ